MQAPQALALFALMTFPGISHAAENESSALAQEITSTVTGSIIKKLLLDNQVVYVESIDGQPIKKAKKHWNDAHPVSTGIHTFVVAYHQGMIHETATFQIDVVPNFNYRFAFESTVKPLAPDQHITYWVEDAETGEKLSDPITVNARIPVIQIISY